MSQPHPTPRIRAYAVVSAYSSTPTLTCDLGRAQQCAPALGGVIHDLYTAPALLAHITATATAPTMNHVTPDPAGATASGAIQHMALCMTIANKAVLHTVRMGWPVGDTDGTWWVDTSPLLDPAMSGAEFIAEVQQHLAVAIFAGLVKPHPVHSSWVQIVSTIGQPAAATDKA